MSESFNELEVPVTEFGAWVRQQRDAHLQASAKAMNDMMSGGGQDAHRATSAQLRAGQQGLYPHMTPYDRGAAAASRQAVVGSDYGGRPLERLGGTFDHSEVGCSPAPPRADMRYVNDPPGLRPTGESAWETWKRGQR
jgi:hypothetical protein